MHSLCSDIDMNFSNFINSSTNDKSNKVIKNLDFDSDPKEFTTKAQKKNKHSPLGITIADGEAVNVSLEKYILRESLMEE